MLKIEFFLHACYFLLYSIAFGIMSDIKCLHQIIFTGDTVFQSLWKNLTFSNNCDIFILDECLQPFG